MSEGCVSVGVYTSVSATCGHGGVEVGENDPSSELTLGTLRMGR